MRQSWVASRSCWRLPIRGSMAKCSRISDSSKRLDGYINDVWWLTVAASLHAVDTQARVLLLDLARLDGGEGLNRAKTRVLGQGHRNSVESIGKGTHGILFDTRALNVSSRVSLAPGQPDVGQRTLTAASSTAKEQAISAAPPPYTTRLSRTKLRTTHKASCSDRLASSMICTIY